MNKMNSVVVDAGNTAIKIGFFIEGELQQFSRISWDDFMAENPLTEKIKKYKGIFSSVLTPEQNQQIREHYPDLIQFSSQHKLPIELDYKTPTSLGVDRLCNAIAAWRLNPNKNSLIVDVGTCLKFDFVSQNGIYQGGSISPGIRLRYQSLNDYTANLPLLSAVDKTNLIGKSTTESIHSGVINGINAEIERLIQQYEENFDSLTIFVTGGDAKYFDFDLKNNIFVTENLTLYGLYETYLFNA